MPEKINKKDFAELLAAKLGETRHVGEKVIETYNKLLIKLVKEGHKVHTGLGYFCKSERAAREGINPRTKQRIIIPPLTTVKYSASSTFKEAIK